MKIELDPEQISDLEATARPEKVKGSFAGDPAFDEVVRLGEKFRVCPTRSTAPGVRTVQDLVA